MLINVLRAVVAAAVAVLIKEGFKALQRTAGR